MTSFGTALRVALESVGLTLEAVGEMAGMGRSHLFSMENGLTGPASVGGAS